MHKFFHIWGETIFLVGSTHRVSFAATEEAEMAEFSKTKKKGKVVEHKKNCAVNIESCPIGRRYDISTPDQV